jgi:hypothetical protein
MALVRRDDVEIGEAEAVAEAIDEGGGVGVFAPDDRVRCNRFSLAPP